MLPYQTLDEAALALGRNLTLAEKHWFNYSANKIDFFLYLHNAFFLFLIVSVAPLPYVFIEFSQYAERMAKFKIQKKITTSFSDMFNCYKDVVKNFFLCGLPIQILAYPTVQWVGIRTSLPLPSLWEILSQLIAYILIEDYTFYWLHRFLHTEWGYEKIHHVHHEFNAPIGISAPYVHWAEIFVLGLPTSLGPLVIPCHMITLYLWIIVRALDAIHIHSGYEFPWNPINLIPMYVSAEYHDYHHYVGKQSQSNFASVFTYCTMIITTTSENKVKATLLRVIVITSKLSTR
ncbi:Fatty acid hydroxylase [Corchorus olitorius]|uniref:Fatty acid hydroxylase n=1 Tax=Corchorus olitorius TaxID=93759 RepID=A0A1R3K0J5_9ROSI|nr:Fatty acid hydroxylase [Corchorus olitorius]